MFSSFCWRIVFFYLVSNHLWQYLDPEQLLAIVMQGGVAPHLLKTTCIPLAESTEETELLQVWLC